MNGVDARFTGLFWTVWRRNLRVYRRIWVVNFLPPILEPVFYLVAFGLGFSGLVADVTWHGQAMGFTQFLAPALIAVSAMWQGYMETTYSSFVRMFYQKTYDALLATPLTLEEIIVAEIVWGATRSLIAATLMLAVVALLGYAPSPQALLILPIAFFGGLAFGAMGMATTSVTPTIDMFNIPIFLFITPMFLFSGTFFPIDALPAWAAPFAAAMPLYHLAELCRAACLGRLGLGSLGHAAVLALFLAAFLPLALAGMRRRLVR
ncbi:MAG: ABC transporter permease [Solidesulfovibrio sp.]|uniref:ABC transporter permease n=1 Tax=Solidesulfovibrio sp. TaxID=2910990 RepID=UPI002B1ED52D|nr:ABC transporter permease [Solidesulfovibrio sp.]MEA4856864.1 ABC transporter permease [Solidesulfovibrio sp.]